MFNYYSEYSQLNMMYMTLWIGLPALLVQQYEFALLALGIGFFLLFTEWGNQIKSFEKRERVKLFSYVSANALLGIVFVYSGLLYVIASVILFVFWLSFISRLTGKE